MNSELGRLQLKRCFQMQTQLDREQQKKPCHLIPAQQVISKMTDGPRQTTSRLHVRVQQGWTAKRRWRPPRVKPKLSIIFWKPVRRSCGVGINKPTQVSNAGSAGQSKVVERHNALDNKVSRLNSWSCDLVHLFPLEMSLNSVNNNFQKKKNVLGSFTKHPKSSGLCVATQTHALTQLLVSRDG